MIDTQAIRKKILDLAIRGKLTEQLPEDGTAEELYQQIQAEKQAQIKAWGIKKEKALPEIAEDEKPFAIPTNWAWKRLCDLSSVSSGGTPSRGVKNYWNGAIPWVKISDITTKYVDSTEESITELGLNNSSAKVFPENTVLYTIFATIGNVGILKIRAATNQAIAGIAFFGEHCLDYMYYILVGLKDNLVSKGKGMTQMNINLTILKNTPIPLPPLAEQKRIVEKIETAFLALDTIDELQAQYADNLAVLKSKLIDLAIRGKLTEQLPEDGTAEELYQQIQAEKQAQIKAGKIKKEKPLPEITEDEIPFEIPDNWAWLRWGNLSFQIQYGYNAPAKEKGDIKMVRITDIQDNKVVWNTVPFCDIEDECIDEYRLRANDILFARTGGTVGKSFLVKKVEEDAIFAGYLIRTNFSTSLNAKYMKYFMESRLYWKQLQDGTTATAQPNCNAKTLSKMIVPLPPLAEQNRIVERLNKILALCAETR